MCVCIYMCVCGFMSWILLSHCPQARLRPPSNQPPKKLTLRPSTLLSCSQGFGITGTQRVGVCVCVCVWECPAVTAGRLVFIHTLVYFLSTWGLTVLFPLTHQNGACWGLQSEQITSPLVSRQYKAVLNGRQVFQWTLAVNKLSSRIQHRQFARHL